MRHIKASITGSLLVLSLGLLADASAAEQLRWKLEADDRLKVVTQQTVTTNTTYTGSAVQSTLELLVESEWLVQSVGDGEIDLSQKVTRARIEMQSPKTDPVIYDSADEKRPTGAARQLQMAVQPLIGLTVQLKMSDRGEVLSVELPPDATADQANGESGPQRPPAEVLKSLLSKPLLVLPEGEVDTGANWEAKETNDSPVGGVTANKSYKLVSIDEANDKRLAQIEGEAKIELQPKAKVKLTEGEFKQTVQFAVDDGMVSSAKQTVRLKTESPYRETTIAVDVTMEETTSLERVK